MKVLQKFFGVFLVAVIGVSTMALSPESASAATGDILAVRISSLPFKDSWVAEIDIEGLSTGGTYNLGLGSANDVSTSRISFNVTSPGFDTAGNATTRTRTIYGSKFVRKAYPNDAQAEETAGGGFVTVRVALTDYIYNADSNITANISSGFYTQGSSNNASSSIAVANTSTLDYPKVIGRWAWPGYERVTGDFLVEAVAFNQFARDGKPLAAMKFVARDESGNTVTQTVTDMTKSTRSGDANQVLVYAATIPTSSLTQGQKIEVNFEAYPWIGVASSTLKSATTSDGFVQPNERLGPLTNVLDKTGAYGVGYVLIDNNGKNGTSTGAVVYSSQAAAESGGSATAFNSIRNAWTAIRAYHLANFGRNDAGGGVILLNEGTYNFATGTMPLTSTMNTWITVKPASTALKANTIIGNGSVTQYPQSLIKIEGLSITGTSTALSGNTSVATGTTLWIHNNTINNTSSSAFYRFNGLYFTQNAITALGSGLNGTFGANRGPNLLARGNNSTPFIQSNVYAVIGNKNVNVPTGGAAFIETVNPYNSTPSENAIYAFNSVMNINNVGFFGPVTSDLSKGIAFVQNVFESQSTTQPLVQISADSSTSTVNNVIIWNNTLIGQRTNLQYNEYASTSVTRYNWSQKNNLITEWNIKTDTFGAGPPNGIRIANWSAIYGASNANNISIETNFNPEFYGTQSLYGAVSASTTIFVSNRSRTGNGAGNGDYNLTFNSIAVDLATSTDNTNQTLPFDFNGNSVYGPMDVGAYEYIPTLTMGVNQVSTSTIIRMYGDEKFRNEYTPTAAGTANLNISIPGSDTRDWLDVAIGTWQTSGSSTRVWTESTLDSSVANTVHTVGDLQPSTSYLVRAASSTANISGCSSGVCTTNGSGVLSFTYTGSYSSPVTFNMQQNAGDVTPPVISGVASSTTQTTATITWTTDEAATDTLAYGLTTSYGATSTNAVATTTHSITLTGLTASTTYNFKIFSTDASSNIASTTNLTFTTSPLSVSAPTVTQQAASSITQTTATLNGTITADGNASSTIRGFNYGTTTAYGLTASTTGTYGLGAFSIGITGLTASTTYFYQAYSTNAGGVGTSTQGTFTTSPLSVSAPTVTQQAASSITQTTATLNGTITADGNASSTIRGFNYGTTTAYGLTASTTGTYGLGAFSIGITGLTASTTYFYQAYSTNAGGVGTSTQGTFTTSPLSVSAPTVTQQAASSITQTTATLNGTITADGNASSTIRGFNYGTTTAYGLTASTTGTYGLGAFSIGITGLTASTTYFYQAYSTNAGGVGTSTQGTFTTSPLSVSAPTVTQQAASSITQTTATLNGTITADGNASSTIRGFNYGTTTAYGLTASTTGTYGLGAFSIGITGLTASTTYFYQAYSTNAGGVGTSTQGTFTTSPLSVSAPTVTQQAASSITQTTATLNGTITADGNASSTIRGFNYGTTTAYGLTASTTGTYGLGAFSIGITGLTASTTYFYQAYSTNAGGVGTSTQGTFTTSAAIDITAPVISSVTVSGIAQTVATISWNTDESATSTVDYGTALSYGSASSSNAYVTSRSLVLTGLTASTTYQFQVSSTDVAGNRATSSNFSFNTIPVEPVISSIVSTLSDTTASISWITNQNSSSRVEYGLTTTYTDSTAETDTSPRVTSHTSGLSGLLACTEYNYRVRSRNATLDEGISSNQKFLTTGCTANSNVSTSTTSTVTVVSGGTVTLPNTVGQTVTITVPSGFTATSTSVVFQAKELNPTVFTSGAGAPSTSVTLVGIPYDLTAYLTSTTTLSTFALPLTITLPYNPATLNGTPESSLAIYRYDTIPGWTALPNCSVNTIQYTVTCETSNFSDFAIFGTAVSNGGGGGGGGGAGGASVGGTTYTGLPATPTDVTGNPLPNNSGLSGFVFNVNLNIGSKHPDVKVLQRFLTSRNHLAPGNETGFYGPKTAQAVMAYQRFKIISPVSGFFGPATRAAANKDIQDVSLVPNTSLPATTTNAYGYYRDLEVGSVGEDVRTLQKFLNGLGYTVAVSGTGSKGNEGITFGSATRAALAKFQKDKGLTPSSGYFGKKTRTFIEAMNR